MTDLETELINKCKEIEPILDKMDENISDEAFDIIIEVFSKVPLPEWKCSPISITSNNFILDIKDEDITETSSITSNDIS